MIAAVRVRTLPTRHVVAQRGSVPGAFDRRRRNSAIVGVGYYIHIWLSVGLDEFLSLVVNRRELRRHP
jgi:hypothetical protein